MEIPKLGLGLKDAVVASGVGRNSLLEAIRSGELPAALIGAEGSPRRRYIIRTADLDGWLERRTGRK